MIMYNLYSYLNFKIVYCLTKTCARFASWVVNILPYCVYACSGIWAAKLAGWMKVPKRFFSKTGSIQPRASVTRKCLRSTYFTQNILHLVHSYSPIFNMYYIYQTFPGVSVAICMHANILSTVYGMLCFVIIGTQNNNGDLGFQFFQFHARI